MKRTFEACNEKVCIKYVGEGLDDLLDMSIMGSGSRDCAGVGFELLLLLISVRLGLR